MKYYKKQSGAVLLWALVILVVLLAMGVASIKMSGLDTRIAGNEMYQMLTYQAAESAISRTRGLYYLDQASKSVNHTFKKSGMIDSTTLANGKAVNINSNATISLPAQFVKIPCPVLTGLANSVNAASVSGAMDCQLYTIQATANLAGASARSQHNTGIVKFIPATP